MLVPTHTRRHLWRRTHKNIMFVHTPKCGGRFIATSFGRHFDRCISIKHPDMCGHLTLLQYRDAFTKNDMDIDEYSLFSVVRNPWEWHLSWYNYIRKDIGGKHSGMPSEHVLFQDFSFLDYLRWLDSAFDETRVNQYYLGQVSDWVIDETGAIAISDILRQETLDQDLRDMQAKYDLKLNIPKSRKNQSFTGDYRSQYCDEGVDIVARRHPRDIALFGYDFESPNAHSSISA